MGLIKTYDEIMAGITGGNDGAQATETPKPKPTANKERRSKGKTAKTKTARIPARVEPGWVHQEIANAILRWIQQSFTVTVDEQEVPFDVGALAEPDEAKDEAGTVENREPSELLARVIAHLFYRTPGLRNVEKRLEGREAKSGILSDLLAFFAQVARNNKHLVPIAIDYAREEMQRSVARAKEKQSAREAKKGGNATQNGAGTGTVELADRREGQ